MRVTKDPEIIFLENIKALIRNLLIENPNYKNGYYAKGNNYIEDTKERARYILERIEQTEHLVIGLDNE